MWYFSGECHKEPVAARVQQKPQLITQPCFSTFRGLMKLNVARACSFAGWTPTSDRLGFRSATPFVPQIAISISWRMLIWFKGYIKMLLPIIQSLQTQWRGSRHLNIKFWWICHKMQTHSLSKGGLYHRAADGQQQASLQQLESRHHDSGLRVHRTWSR